MKMTRNKMMNKIRREKETARNKSKVRRRKFKWGRNQIRKKMK